MLYSDQRDGRLAQSKCGKLPVSETEKRGKASSAIAFGLLVCAAQGALAASHSQDSSGFVSFEAENFHRNVARPAGSWVLEDRYGGSGTGGMIAYDVRGVKVSFFSDSPRLDYNIDFRKTGHHYVWLRVRMPSTGSNSVFAGIDQDESNTRTISAPTSTNFQWRRTSATRPLQVSKTGVQTLSLWVRESQALIDQIVITSNRDFSPPSSGAAIASSSNSGGTDSTTTEIDSGSGYTTDSSGSSGGAVDDYVTMAAGTGKIRINVVGNDSGFDPQNYQVTVVDSPNNGRSKVGLSNDIHYWPDYEFVGKDSMVYWLTDNKGFSSYATFTVDVGCSPCGSAPDSSDGGAAGSTSGSRLVTLSWAKNSRTVDGYRVFFGPTSSTTSLIVGDISVRDGTLDPNYPTVTLDSKADLGSGVADQVCFRVQGYNEGGNSEQSAAVCKTL